MNRRAFLLGCGFASAASAVEIDPSAKKLRAQILDAERAIDRRFQTLTEETPPALLGATRGMYIADYGLVFSLQVNLVPVAGISPFRQAYSEEEKRQLNIRKRARLETLEIKSRQILVEETAKLTLLRSDDRAALAVTLFHFPWEDLTALPTQMVLSAPKAALDRARAGDEAAARALKFRYF